MEQSRIDNYSPAGAMRRAAAPREMEPRKRRGGRTRDLESESESEGASGGEEGSESESGSESGGESEHDSRSGGDERRGKGRGERRGGANRDTQVGTPSGKGRK